MARTPITAFGRLSMHYNAYGKDHVARFYVPEFQTDPAVGTFVTPVIGAPADLDSLATDITAVMGPLYQTASGLAFGDWIGEKHTGGESFVTINNGTITPGSFSLQSNTANQPGAPSQATWTFRDVNGKAIRFEQLGCAYVGSTVFRYGGLGGTFLSYANYVLGSARILSRDAQLVAAMVSLTFDTNDGLQRRYRR